MDVKVVKERMVDVEDALLLVAIACVVGGIAMWSRPAALIVFGLICFAVCIVLALKKRAEERESAGKRRKRKSGSVNGDIG
jgi:uncharacterized membrane protein YedE/YeeE